MELVTSILKFSTSGCVLLLVGFLIGWFVVALVKNAFLPTNQQTRTVEKVDIIEGGSIVEQQRSGRELNRLAEVEIPRRPLSFEEQLNLRSILDSGNENVKVVSHSDK